MLVVMFVAVRVSLAVVVSIRWLSPRAADTKTQPKFSTISIKNFGWWELKPTITAALSLKKQNYAELASLGNSRLSSTLQRDRARAD
jgi:hypothetical protein